MYPVRGRHDSSLKKRLAVLTKANLSRNSKSTETAHPLLAQLASVLASRCSLAKMDGRAEQVCSQ